MTETEPKEIKLLGISGSPGICIGKAYLLESEEIDIIEKYSILEENITKEISRFKNAVQTAKDELRALINNTPEELREHVYILETHKVLLKDKMLYGKTIETIQQEKINAEWALKKVLSELKALFQNMSDSYLKERSSDIVHVTGRIMRNLKGSKPVKIADIDKRVIIVAEDLSPAETSQINLKKVKGFLTDRGGRASHTSIIARTLEIPAVMGLDNATRIIKNDDLLILDGANGIVIVHPSDQTLEEYEALKDRYRDFKKVIIKQSHLPAQTKDGKTVTILGNIEFPEEVETVINNGGDGIGLYRTEFQYLKRLNFPNEEELFENYKNVIQTIHPKTVTIRTLDINGDKALAHSTEKDEENPALGLRGIRYCLKKKEVFITQLRAILRASIYGNIRLMFPMISNLEEVLEAKKILQNVSDALDKENIKYNKDIQIGILLEVPSAVIMADTMADEVDFFSIGTNDLIQYSLAIDRNNIQVSHYYHPLHPAIIRMLKSIADVGKEKNVSVSICGEMASDPINIPILLGLGMGELSMNPQSIPAVKSMIRSIDLNDAEHFVIEVLKKTKASDILDLVQNTFCQILPEKIYSD